MDLHAINLFHFYLEFQILQTYNQQSRSYYNLEGPPGLLVTMIS
jgi:hypothetical protein